MKYYVRVGETEYEVVIDGSQVSINGEAVTVDLVQSGVPELYSILFNGQSHDMLVETERSNYAITFRSEQFQVQVEDERTRRLNTGRKAPSVPKGELVVKAPIPGLVVKVLVEKGATVAEGQPLVILEAMKMENEIRSVRAGIVKNVSVAAGQRVEQNQAMLVLE
ncbi:MAG: biotin/lipoyl-binding protein [Chloroflexota bacterium]|nr:biotin/lipoyl-binding protein [Chloroflexota bacterium]